MWRQETSFTRHELAIRMRLAVDSIVFVVQNTTVGTLMDLTTLGGAEELFNEYGKIYGKLYEESQ